MLGFQFVATFGEGPLLYQQDCNPVHKARPRKTWCEKFGVEELKSPAQIPDFNPTGHLWDAIGDG